MTPVLISNNMHLKRGIRKRTVSTNIRFGVVSLLFLVVGLFTVMSLLYLMHFNSASTKGYELNRLENERQQLVSENEIQNMRLSEARALVTIEKHPIVQRMVKVNPEKITYMKNDNAVAIK